MKLAVFDFDGTLIRVDSMIVFFRRYFKFSLSTIPILFKLILEAAKYYLKITSQRDFKEKYLNLILRSRNVKDYGISIGREYAKFLCSKIYPQAKEEIQRLKKEGYETILLSASPDFYLNGVKDTLGFSSLICTETAGRDGRLFISGDNCYGEMKIKKLQEVYDMEKVDLSNSYCYTDHLSDLALLSIFGRAFAVNNPVLAAKKPHFKYVSWKE